MDWLDPDAVAGRRGVPRGVRGARLARAGADRAGIPEPRAGARPESTSRRSSDRAPFDRSLPPAPPKEPYADIAAAPGLAPGRHSLVGAGRCRVRRRARLDRRAALPGAARAGRGRADGHRLAHHAAADPDHHTRPTSLLAVLIPAAALVDRDLDALERAGLGLAGHRRRGSGCSGGCSRAGASATCASPACSGRRWATSAGTRSSTGLALILSSAAIGGPAHRHRDRRPAPPGALRPVHAGRVGAGGGRRTVAGPEPGSALRAQLTESGSGRRARRHRPRETLAPCCAGSQRGSPTAPRSPRSSRACLPTCR